MVPPPARAPQRPLRPRSLRVNGAFRLDLTVALLQRLPTHPVEVWTADGRYLRVFETPAGPVAWRVSQAPRGSELRIALHGPAGDPGPWRARIRRALGLDVDLSAFHEGAACLPGLATLARAMTGVRPPRFAALHEAFASVVPFQQVSLRAAVAVLRRVVVSLTSPVEVEGVVLHPFPAAEAIARAPDALLRGAGLSAAKVRTLPRRARRSPPARSRRRRSSCSRRRC
jgi:DNA-3-methyladenine glycosylase II